jgi:hypothetical protein
MINRALTNALLLAILCRLVDMPAWGRVLMAISFVVGFAFEYLREEKDE